LSKTIFYLEDSDICFEVTRLMLNELGEFELIRADTIAGAQNLIEASASDDIQLILLDVMLPDGNASEIVPLMKAKRDCPVIAYTACNTSADMSKLMRAGFDDVLSKPLSLNHFKTMLTELTLI
jgi:CheY-like chemotaxis protein